MGVTVAGSALIAASVVLAYLAAQLWPPQGAASDNPPVTLLVWDDIPVTYETRLLLLIVVIGALGGMIHSVRSFAWYVGHRQLRWSWLAFYVIRPVTAAGLALVVYVVLRGGLFSSQGGTADANHYGFAALAALSGMFSEQAVEKLRQVTETVLAEAPEGGDRVKPSNARPASRQAGHTPEMP